MEQANTRFRNWTVWNAFAEEVSSSFQPIVFLSIFAAWVECLNP